MLQRIKRIPSHAGLARYLRDCDDTHFEIPRQPDIPSPYACCPTHSVYSCNAEWVIIVETKHKQYDVFAVPSVL